MKIIRFGLLLLVISVFPSCDQKIAEKYNTCQSDSDCQFVDFAGGCFTSDYAQIMILEAQTKGTDITSSPPRVPPQPNTVCECLENQCVLKK